MVRPIAGHKAILDFQLKGTRQDIISADWVFYDLSIKNYNDLRSPSINPHYLLVLHLWSEPENWLEVDDDWLILNGIAYWGNLYDLPSTSNAATQRVHLPREQALNVCALKTLMNAAPDRLGMAKV